MLWTHYVAAPSCCSYVMVKHSHLHIRCIKNTKFSQAVTHVDGFENS